MGRRLANEKKRSTVSDVMYEAMMDAVWDEELEPEVRYGRVTLCKYRALLAVMDSLRGIGKLIAVLGGVVIGLLIAILDALLRTM